MYDINRKCGQRYCTVVHAHAHVQSYSPTVLFLYMYSYCIAFIENSICFACHAHGVFAFAYYCRCIIAYYYVPLVLVVIFQVLCENTVFFFLWHLLWCTWPGVFYLCQQSIVAYSTSCLWRCQGTYTEPCLFFSLDTLFRFRCFAHRKQILCGVKRKRKEKNRKEELSRL